MPYRDFTLPDGRVVRTRVSDEATLDWYESREMSIAQGYPDRPPDIDSGGMRGWIGEADDNPPARVSSVPIASYVATGERVPNFKIIIAWLTPGDSWHIRFKVESKVSPGKNVMDGERFIKADDFATLNEVINSTIHIVEDLLALGSSIGLHADVEWLVTPPSETMRLADEMEIARDEYEAEFGTRTGSPVGGALEEDQRHDAEAHREGPEAEHGVSAGNSERLLLH